MKRISMSLLAAGMMLSSPEISSSEPINQETFDLIVSLANQIKTHDTPIEIVDITNVTIENATFEIDFNAPTPLIPEITRRNINAANCHPEDEREWKDTIEYTEHYGATIEYVHRITTENTVNLSAEASVNVEVFDIGLGSKLSAALAEKETIEITNSNATSFSASLSKVREETVNIPPRKILIYQNEVVNEKVSYPVKIGGTINALLWYHVLVPPEYPYPQIFQQTSTGKHSLLFTAQWLKSVFFDLQPGPRVITVPGTMVISGFEDINVAYRFVDVDDFPTFCDVKELPQGLADLVNYEGGLVVTKEVQRIGISERR